MEEIAAAADRSALERSLRWFRRPEHAIFALLVLVQLAPIWLFRFFPSQDGPAHLNSAVGIWQYVSNPDSVFRVYYTLNSEITANWPTHLLLLALMRAFPVLIAEKILLSGYVLLFAVAVRYALAAAKPEAKGFSYLALPFIANWTLHMGFYNFAYGLPLLFFSLGLYLRLERVFSLGRVFALVGLSIALYLLHGLIWAIAFNAVLCLALWSAVIERRISPRKLGVAALAYLPGLLFFLSFRSGSGRERLEWIDFERLLSELSRLSVLGSYQAVEYRYSTALLVVFALLILGGLARRLRERGLQRGDGLLLLVFGLLGAYFSAPDWFVGVGLLSIRLQLFPFLIAILWFGSLGWPIWVVRSVQTAAAVVSVALVASHLQSYRLINATLEEYVECASEIEPNSTLLTLSMNWSVAELERESVLRHIQPLQYAGGYLAAARRSVHLNNYEGTLGWFPLVYREGRNPFTRIPGIARIPTAERFLELLEPAEVDGGDAIEIDYVLHWDSGERPADVILRRQYRLIELVHANDLTRGGYRRIYRSKRNGSMNLWRSPSK